MDYQLSVKNIIKSHKLQASKSLGQNYIIDTNITDHIAKSVGNLKDAIVIEIGPGVGTLTHSLLTVNPPAHILTIEKDIQFQNVLDQLVQMYPNKLSVLYEDALNFNIMTNSILQNISDQHKTSKITIIANLPYNIGTQLLLKWLKHIYDNFTFSKENNNYKIKPLKIDSITIMLQKEVVQRIVATSQTKAYGLLSVLSQWLCDVEKLFDVAPSSFWPIPKVTSSVIHITPQYQREIGCRFEQLKFLCKTCFQKRRKMLRNSLSDLITQYPTVEKLLENKLHLRPESLTILDFVEIAKTISCITKTNS
jgi:16S rRNA (adenine1518-N6/adenine1519-N6)-dimethyltransferase